MKMDFINVHLSYYYMIIICYCCFGYPTFLKSFRKYPQGSNREFFKIHEYLFKGIHMYEPNTGLGSVDEVFANKLILQCLQYITGKTDWFV